MFNFILGVVFGIAGLIVFCAILSPNKNFDNDFEDEEEPMYDIYTNKKELDS